MSHDFPRIITLLRKERGLSQKEAAAGLGVSQALLSHYETGKRECSLDFVVTTADYYRVSCDYLLGRTTERSGATIAITELPTAESNSPITSTELLLGKRLILNSLSVIFDLLMQVGNTEISDASISMLMVSVYRVLRVLHVTNKANPRNMFTIPSYNYCAVTSGYTSIREANAINIARKPKLESDDRMPVNISPEKLSEGYPLYAPSLLNLMKIVEESINKDTKSAPAQS